jgi:hypothetical protein
VLRDVDLPCASHERVSFRSRWYAISLPCRLNWVLNGALALALKAYEH